jgi:hypothetical protein
MVARRGGMKLGVLATFIFIGALGYFGVNIGKHYWRYVRFQDRMEQQVRFSASRPDSVIRARLQAVVDSLGLPESARNIRVRRAEHLLFIYADYVEIIEFPGFAKEIHFAPKAVGPY